MEHNDQIIAVNSEFLELCGITASTEPRSRIWHYTHEPERFASVTSRVQDYATAFMLSEDVRALAPRARVDAILIMSLALAKRKWLTSAEGGIPQPPRGDAENRLGTLFSAHGQAISLRGLSLNPCDIRYAVMDDVLWYGEPGNPKANLVVVRTEELRVDSGMAEVQYLAVLAAIATIQHNRAKSPVLDEICAEDVQAEARGSLGGKKHWEIAPTERRTVSSHLRRNLEDIQLVYGRAAENQAVIRLTIDAVLLDIMTSIKSVDFNQYGEEKGPGKRASSETTTSRKSLQMSLENPITYVYNTAQGKKQVKGRMVYTLWYGKRNEAETNLMVFEAKTVGGVQAGRYQAISYMALLQDARTEAGRAKTPIYGIATDMRDWDFIRMDANGVVDVHSLSWDGKEDKIVISLIHNIVNEASFLSSVSSNTLLTRQKTVEELTGLLVTKN
ncbi:hypothetical protein BJY01DRAFT_251092 [Aspergillus pseudoustus]|uniref:Uncharacterized protein n=1 Tax=Aspergillus pseudoustus TaxID=1810923 RepID=A0ABR4JDZ7_9EURO